MKILQAVYYTAVISVTLLVWTVLLTSCTISLQNISSNGKAQDMVTDDMTTDPDIKPDLTVPLQGMI